MVSTSGPRLRDVFICFSKARPGEAKVAIALKDELEQLGLFAFEYEDWSWIGAGASEAADVDRQALRRMLTTAVVVLISPHGGEASAGVQTEISELRSCGAPVILLHWSPYGWQPLLDPPALEGLNIVWSYEGKSSGEGDVADNQCGHLARQLATGSWLACELRRQQANHPRTAAALLARIPEGPRPPLLNFQLQRPATHPTEWEDPVDVTVLAADVAARASGDELEAFRNAWRDGTDLQAEKLAKEARFSLRRPLQTFHDACEALCQQAEARLTTPGLPGSVLKTRGLTLARLDRSAHAIEALEEVPATMEGGERYEVYQAMALAQQALDPRAAIDSLTSAIACAPQLEIACTLQYNRAVVRFEAALRDEALEDFSFVVERSTSPVMRHSALRARARLLTEGSDHDGAIRDYTRLLAEAEATPRTAVSAWMDRGWLYRLQGRSAEAIADFTRAIESADCESLQRFHSLDARAQELERSGQHRAAAADYETMASYSEVPRERREELLRTAERLRGDPRER
jgi:tetratricopeptide (TPR) repeat protein